MKDFEIIAHKLLGLRVCSSLSPEETERRSNEEAPCGTTNGWKLSTRPEVAPVACKDAPDTHKHYILDC